MHSLNAGEKQVVFSYSLGISAQARTLKLSSDCADTVLSGRTFQSRIAVEKKDPSSATTGNIQNVPSDYQRYPTDSVPAGFTEIQTFTESYVWLRRHYRQPQEEF